MTPVGPHDRHTAPFVRRRGPTAEARDGSNSARRPALARRGDAVTRRPAPTRPFRSDPGGMTLLARDLRKRRDDPPVTGARSRMGHSTGRTRALAFGRTRKRATGRRRLEPDDPFVAEALVRSRVVGMLKALVPANEGVGVCDPFGRRHAPRCRLARRLARFDARAAPKALERAKFGSSAGKPERVVVSSWVR